MSSYFREGRGLDAKELAGRFKAGKAEGKEACAGDTAVIEQAKAAHAEALAALERELAEGRISQDEFEQRAKAMVP